MGTSADPLESVSRLRLPADDLAPSAARKFLRATLAGLAAPPAPGLPAVVSERLVDDAVLLVSELTTATLARGGFEIEIGCRVESGPDTRHGLPAPPPPDGTRRLGIVVEVLDRHLSGAGPAGSDLRSSLHGHGLRLLSALADTWGVTCRQAEESVWFRLDSLIEGRPGPPDRETAAPDAQGTAPDRTGPAPERSDRAGASFLAEVSELLAGQLDEDMVTALTSQLLVPRLADWCAVWLTTTNGRMRISRVWHRDEQQIRTLRSALEQERPPPDTLTTTTALTWPWPEGADAVEPGGSALLFPLVASGRCHGALLVGRAGLPRMTDAVVRLTQDVARRAAQAVVTARHYTRQADISHSLQRRQLPTSLASIPGVDTAIVYEPSGEGQTVGGDFYDLFPMGESRWCFLLGDVCGHDLEAMSVTGLARHLVRLLAREGHGVEALLHRLNLAMAEEGAEAVAVGGEQAGSRFLSLLYGELEPEPVAGGARLTVASAGHPLPLLLSADGAVRPAADPQMLLGIDERAEFRANSFHLAPGEILLCVTDGVTERRRGNRQLDDDDGLAELLRGCAGLGAKAVAERVRQAAHDFGPDPIDDDLAVLVLEALPVAGAGREAGSGTGVEG
ncbi:ATP-binding SpoIIE family protein phosphatase [Streptomyces cavernicola]|uniref:SpoIIE family protein phosphatase n=1 Tax=Streptomyces cavernicola TaxID=3043613 RepID=A0ABT6S782_9ACTN|nr:ATP-binding SpoIIE family protein phosphatase [Streptomyces sp. B-S-A6]MDI3403954.1 SpoIIE family protein phosphatase [Streptomyces sp. B-S-A6]